jgi:hypothetical protein
MMFGSKYGHLANRPVGLNTEGKFRAGSAKYPPIEATSVSIELEEMNEEESASYVLLWFQCSIQKASPRRP